MSGLRKEGEVGMRLIDAHELIRQTIMNPVHPPYITTNDIDSAPTVTPEPGWISVKDRMPPSHETVIVSINDDRGDNDYRYAEVGWYFHGGKCWIVDDEATINVEAWMPFPKPYKLPKEGT